MTIHEIVAITGMIGGPIILLGLLIWLHWLEEIDARDERDAWRDLQREHMRLLSETYKGSEHGRTK